MSTQEMKHTSGIRSLSDAELDQVSGGWYAKTEDQVDVFVRALFGDPIYQVGTLDSGLHR